MNQRLLSRKSEEADLDAVLQEYQKELEDVNTSIKNFRTLAVEVEEQKNSWQKKAAQTSHELEEAVTEFHKAQSKLESLKNIAERYDGYGNSIRKVMEQKAENKGLLTFISKNLSWGIFKNALTTPASDGDINFTDVYYGMLSEAPYQFKDPEIMLFMIIELVSSTCYSAILYEDPCPIGELKPHLYESIRLIISRHKIESGK